MSHAQARSEGSGNPDEPVPQYLWNEVPVAANWVEAGGKEVPQRTQSNCYPSPSELEAPTSSTTSFLCAYGGNARGLEDYGMELSEAWHFVVPY